MGLRAYRPTVGGISRNDPNYVTRSNTDHLPEPVRKIAQELVLRVAQKTDNALGIDTRWFFYYKRRSVGRRCSCIAGEQSTASATCGICYGTSVVGGYDKYGCATEVMDCTYPSLDLINIVQRPEPRPSALVLDPDATTGVIQGRLRIRKNAGYVDHMHAHMTAGVTLEFRPAGSDTWVSATSDNLTGMLDRDYVDVKATTGVIQGRLRIRKNAGYVDHMHAHMTAGVTLEFRPAGSDTWVSATSDNLTGMLDRDYVDVKATLHRASTKDDSPVFLKLFVRYGLLPQSEIQLPGDIPPNTEAISLQEYGFDEQFGTISVVMGSAGHGRTSKITTFSNEDFLYYIERARHWKITEVKPNYALGVFTSFDLTARWVQSFEAYKKFPV